MAVVLVVLAVMNVEAGEAARQWTRVVFVVSENRFDACDPFPFIYRRYPTPFQDFCNTFFISIKNPGLIPEIREYFSVTTAPNCLIRTCHAMSDTQQSTQAGAGPLFLTTHWSVVLAAQNKSSPNSAAALEALCRTYWYPLYALVRRQGHSPHDAQDLTQSFFERLLEKDYLQAADRDKGRFRTFLSVALRRFLANEWDRKCRLKRGGGQVILSLDTANAERRYQAEPPVDQLSADHIFERRWAMTLLDLALSNLKNEYAGAGKTLEFEQLKEYLTAERGSVPYGTIASDLSMSEGAARVAVYRLRKRFRELFRAAVADTVSNPDEVEEELRHVASILSCG